MGLVENRVLEIYFCEEKEQNGMRYFEGGINRVLRGGGYMEPVVVLNKVYFEQMMQIIENAYRAAAENLATRVGAKTMDLPELDKAGIRFIGEKED